MSKEEFYEVWLLFKLDGSWDEFESDWAEYEKIKERTILRRSLK